MTTYVKATDFAVKDALVSGNPSKLVKGTEINTEFTAIQAADATNVKGPGSAVTDNALMRYDGVTGYLSQNSVGILTDAGLLSGVTNVNYVTSTTGSSILPSGTTAQRDGSPVAGYLRYNSTLGQFEGYTTTWGSIGGSGGATGGGTDETFVENDTDISAAFTIGSGSMTSGVTVTIATPAVFTLTAHGFLEDMQVRLTTTGALPTGLSSTNYFVIAAGLTANDFRLSATRGGSAINTSGSQSGTHSVGRCRNAQTAGPVTTLNSGSVTIPDGCAWVING